MTCRLCNGTGYRMVNVFAAKKKQLIKDPVSVLKQYISSHKVKNEICCDCNGTGKIERVQP